MQRRVAQKHTVGTNSNNVALALEMQEDILCLVLVAINDKPTPNYSSISLNKDFNSKEIALLQAAFDKMNGLEEDVIEDFLASAEEVETVNTQPAQSSAPRKLSLERPA